MSSHKVKSIESSAILLANNLRTGLTVYLRDDSGWSANRQDAWILTNDAEADMAKAIGARAAADNDVIDPYLVDTTLEGDPTHIRERLRTTGPSVDYLPTRTKYPRT